MWVLIVNCNPRSMARTRLSRRLMIMPIQWHCLTVWGSLRRSIWRIFIHIILPTSLLYVDVPVNSRSSFSKVKETNAEEMALEYLEKRDCSYRSRDQRNLVNRQVERPNSVDRSFVNRIGQRLSAAAPITGAAMPNFGLTFLFWFRDDSRLSQLILFSFF